MPKTCSTTEKPVCIRHRAKENSCPFLRERQRSQFCQNCHLHGTPVNQGRQLPLGKTHTKGSAVSAHRAAGQDSPTMWPVLCTGLWAHPHWAAVRCGRERPPQSRGPSHVCCPCAKHLARGHPAWPRNQRASLPPSTVTAGFSVSCQVSLALLMRSAK